MKLFDAEIQCDGEEIKIPRNAKLANFCASLAPYHTISLFVWGGGSLCSNYINVYTYNYVFIYIYTYSLFFLGRTGVEVNHLLVDFSAA